MIDNVFLLSQRLERAQEATLAAKQEADEAAENIRKQQGQLSTVCTVI